MKAKNSLRAMLWPLLKQKIQEGTRYFTSFLQPCKQSRDKGRLNLKALEQEIIESGKKLESSRQKAERYKLESTIPRILPDGGNVVKYHDRDNDKGEGSEVQMSWREDEEDRSYVQECFDRLSMTAGVVWSLLIGKRLSHRGPALATLAPHNDGVMGMRWILVLVLIMGIYSAKVNAQNSAGLRPGDKIPDVTISNLINYKTSTAKLSDFKGKLLILDFWSTWCKGCLESFENADILQKQFGNQLQVLFITPQSSDLINKFLLKNTRISGYKPVIATDDKNLQKLFPYVSVPHLAWISPEGKLIQTTEAVDFTASTIDKILKNQEVTFVAPKVVSVR